MGRQTLLVSKCHILRELLVNGYAKHEESGFVITLNDIYGATVEIVYDRLSQMIGDLGFSL